MTLVCVLIVAAIGIPILERTSDLYRRALVDWDSSAYAALLPPTVTQFRVELRLIAGRAGRFVGTKWSRRWVCFTARFGLGAWELLVVSAVMQMGVALPMAYYFHRANTLGLPANIIVVPLTQLMMPAAVAAVALGYVSPWLAKVPAIFTTFAIDSIAGSVRGIGMMHLANLRVPMPPILMMILAAGALVFAMWAARQHRFLAIGGLAAVLVVSMALGFFAPPARTHPGLETLKRLTDAGARVYRTDLDGAMTFYHDGHSVTPSVAVLQ
jgi:competence protein ComEC